MSLLERIVVGQTFTAPYRPGGPVVTWQIISSPMWSTAGDRFVWCKAVRPLVGHRVPSTPVPWHVADLPGDIGRDLRSFYTINPHLPVASII